MLYRATFYRFNYGFSPPLRQTAEVVFTCDVPREDEAFSDAVHEAMWSVVFVQNPQWNDHNGPVPDRPGWSSVMGGYDVELANSRVRSL